MTDAGPEIPLVDAHVHLLDFLQEGGSPEELVQRMDEEGIEAAVVFGMPYKKKWGAHEPARPSYYLDDESECYPWIATDEAVERWYEAVADRERFAPTLCGVDPTDMDSARRVDELLSTRCFVGVGELLLRHGRLSAHVVTERPRANHPAMRRIVDVCVRHGAPLAVHQNAGSTGQGATAYVAEMQELLGWQSEVPVVWCHAGVSGEQITPPPQLLDELLDRYPHLHMDVSWSAIDGVLSPKQYEDHWLELLSDWPTRFVWGSDSVGRFDELGREAHKVRTLLAELDEETRTRVARGNARRIWFEGGGTR